MQDSQMDAGRGQVPPPSDFNIDGKEAPEKPLATPAEVERLWTRLARARPRKPRSDPGAQGDVGQA